MSKRLNLSRQKFGLLTVIGDAPSTEHGHARYLCLCDCGNTTIVRGNALKTGAVASSGCKVKHGATTSASTEKQKILYRCWQYMRRRCFLPSHPDFKNYGARGVYVCAQWSFF